MRILTKIIFILKMTLIFSNEYYVSITYGDDDNNGTALSTPFKTIQKASSVISAGDICYIRQGMYYETIFLENNNGENGSPIIFTNYNDEKVVLDGTKGIDSLWVLHSDNIWKTTLDFDIWQLFVERSEMIMARWPNASFDDGSIWDKENHWGHGTIDLDENSYSNGTLIDYPHG